MRGVLSIFGDLFGLKFQEIPQGHQSRQAPIATYLKFQNLTEHNTALDVFLVFDITGNMPKRLGSLILDVGERKGKPGQVYCTTFGSVRKFLIFFRLSLLFSVFLAKNRFLIDLKSSFHLKMNVRCICLVSRLLAHLTGQPQDIHLFSTMKVYRLLLTSWLTPFINSFKGLTNRSFLDLEILMRYRASRPKNG